MCTFAFGITKQCSKPTRQKEKLPGRSPTTSLKSTAKVRRFFNKNNFYMKNVLKTILAVACFAGIILAGCENPDGSCNIIWTLGFLALSVIAGYGLKKMEEAK